MSRRRLAFVVLFVPLVAAVACGGGPAGGDTTETQTLRLGFFPNVTHAAALAGVGEGIFARELGSGVKLETKTFNAGPEAVDALFAEALDATYIGPNPAVNAFKQSKGEAVRIIAGATAGGASLVVKPEITDAAALKGKTLSTPQVGNTQDVALRTWLKSKSLSSNEEGGGDVKIQPQQNAQTLETFQAGKVDGAWVPEPWASRLELDGGGKQLVDERTLWPDGKFVTAHLIVRTKFLEEHPDIVKKLLRGHVAATNFLLADAAIARKAVNDELESLTSKPLSDAVIKSAWGRMSFGVEPYASSLQKMASDAIAVGLLEPIDLKGIYDLTLLNEILKDDGQSEVSGL